MKPGAFTYVAVSTVHEALEVLAESDGDVSILAGGQSLVPLMNLRLSRPDLLLDVNGLTELNTLTADVTGVRAGALARASQVEKDPGVRALHPVIAAAIGHNGHPQIRNRTTIGGNIAHADPSSELPGVLACVDGTVTLTSLRGSRVVRWSDFFDGVFTTCREFDELVTEVTFPAEAGMTYKYDEVAIRHGDYPLAGVTVGCATDGQHLTELRVSVVGVADRPVRLGDVEAVAIGVTLDDEGAAHLGRLAASTCPASDDAHASAEYRRHIVGTLTRRILEEAAG